MSSTIDLCFGIFIGYILGVIKEKLKWIEKSVSFRRREKVEELLEDEE